MKGVGAFGVSSTFISWRRWRARRVVQCSGCSHLGEGCVQVLPRKRVVSGSCSEPIVIRRSHRAHLVRNTGGIFSSGSGTAGTDTVRQQLTLPGVEDNGAFSSISLGDDDDGSVGYGDSGDGVSPRYGDDGCGAGVGNIKRANTTGAASVLSIDRLSNTKGAVAAGGIAKFPVRLSDAMGKVATKDGIFVAHGVAVGSSRGSSSSQRAQSQVSKLAEKVASLLKVPSAQLPVEPRSEDVLDVDKGLHELMANVGGGNGGANFDGLYQRVPNQGLPVNVDKHIEEGWFYSERFAALPNSSTLLSITYAHCHNFLTSTGAWQERWKHSGRPSCENGGSVLLWNMERRRMSTLPSCDS